MAYRSWQVSTLFAAAGACLWMGCSTNRPSPSSSPGSAGDASTAAKKCASDPSCGANGSNDSSGGAPGSLFGMGSLGTPREAGTCASERRTGESVPADLFVMLDQSGSMTDSVTGGVKWDLLTKALNAFVDDPASAGMGVGLGYFPVPPSDTDYSCDAADYAKPAIPIAPLPANGPLISASIAAHTPGGHTPSVPAITGAIAYARTWQLAHPSHRTVVVFATDGDPNGCSSTVKDAAAAAAAGSSDTPSISTYVIGVGKSLSKLDEIAQSGGTDKAFIVDTAGDTEQQFLQAMNQIRAAAAVSCEFTIPETDGGAVDPGKVNVVVTPGIGSALHLVQVEEAACSSSGGWFYDDPAAPKKIELCDATCTAVKADPLVAVDVLLGCQTVTATIQ